MTKDKALQMALDFIERVNKDGWLLADFEPEMYVVITAIKEALAQPEQEPIGYLSVGGAERLVTKKQTHEQIRNFRLFANDVFVYTTPPRRTWVGLTDDEIEHVRNDQPWWAIRAIEAKLKEKNSGHI